MGMLRPWAFIDAYLDGNSYIDLEYARCLYIGCQVSNNSSYDWLEFCDRSGLIDDGDFYIHAVYPEKN